jgi:hypothetical protein
MQPLRRFAVKAALASRVGEDVAAQMATATSPTTILITTRRSKAMREESLPLLLPRRHLASPSLPRQPLFQSESPSLSSSNYVAITGYV